MPNVETSRLVQFMERLLTLDEQERRITANFVAAWVTASGGTSDWHVAMDRYCIADRLLAEEILRRH